MDQRLMRAMLDVDEHHWWYRGRREIVCSELQRLPLRRPAQLLDAGCGSGRMLEELAPYGEVKGIELDEDALEVAISRGVGEVKRGRLEELPFADASFDLVTCLDVREHLADDREALGELRRVTRPGGWLLLTVPAYPALWSQHDVANHHYRRYKRRGLRVAAVDAGWSVRRMTSFNMILLPAAATVRLLQRRRATDGNYTPELELGPRWLNSVLELPMRAEARWLGSGRRLPAGLSLLAVLQNPSPGT